MAVTDADEERIVRLLCQDLRSTLGPGHDGLAIESASRVRPFINDPLQFAQRVVDDTQQDVHDLHIDSTWPRCPRHHRHPLWLREDAWWCEEDRVRVANLGELAADES